MFLSIITPTFNRGYILSNCYKSLLLQTCNDFEWVVVDDGSTDDTEQIVKNFINEGKLKIKYIKQKNGGKHRAHNVAVRASEGEMIICVDSDDLLTEDAVYSAKQYWEENKTKAYVGILAKRGDLREKKAICATWPEYLKSSTMFGLSEKYGFYGDTALFFRADILKKNLFIEFEDEKFLPESNLYCDLDKIGEMLLLDKVLYLCEYLPDGLTAKFHELLKKNPNGTADTYYKMMCLSDSIKGKLKYAVLVNIYRNISNSKEELQFSSGKVWLLITKIPSVVLKKYFFKKVDSLS